MDVFSRGLRLITKKVRLYLMKYSDGFGRYTDWWIAEEKNAGNGYFRNLVSYDDNNPVFPYEYVGFSPGYKDDLRSVRCVKN